MATVTSKTTPGTTTTATATHCQCSQRQWQIAINMMDLFVGSCMVARSIDFFRYGSFDLVIRGFWSFLIGATLIIMVFFVFRILYDYMRFLLTFLGRGLVYFFFASVIGGSSPGDTLGFLIYWGFLPIGGMNILAHFMGMCGAFPLRYPRPFFNTVKFGGTTLGTDLDNNPPSKGVYEAPPPQRGLEFGNNGPVPSDPTSKKEVSNPFGNPDGGVGGGAY